MKPKLTNIQILIQQGDLQTAITQLIELTENTHYHNEIILHAASFKQLQKSDCQGILSSEDIRRERNRLTYALLEVIHEINPNPTQITNNNQQNRELLDIIKQLANKPIHVEAKAVSQGNINQTHSNIGDNIAGDKNITYNDNSQNITEAINEIQTIYQKVAENYPDNTTTQGIKTIEIIENNPTLKNKLITAAKERGLAALEKALDNPVGAFAIAAIKSWINS
ncbi:MAG: hypothetical protein QNJ33_06790 [Crocosphaera sp.]|nr:hypothetical protein [Crocosphaera sp.]